MKITVTPNTVAPALPKFPVLMIADDGCIKLFFDINQGVVLAAASGGGSYTRLDFGSSANNCTPITSSYWKPYDGVITLSNN